MPLYGNSGKTGTPTGWQRRRVGNAGRLATQARLTSQFALAPCHNTTAADVLQAEPHEIARVPERGFTETAGVPELTLRSDRQRTRTDRRRKIGHDFTAAR
ncbi:hypothetical protein [Amycolatopsis jiangsuensis]|uniref:Uncharacterized protein n=1 Tax=Amycolatopsis jiangsuensis TaxID=1181879 RepID=A0A840IY83_9PSEU|nr:hypothetical protein [Amycolatopsis jiangsuensis]MBB4686355.1 hypothetical protein [Amycolatopsis jiangsuensis]